VTWIERTTARLRRALLPRPAGPLARFAVASAGSRPTVPTTMPVPATMPAPPRPGEPPELAWSDTLFLGPGPREQANPDALLWQRGHDVYRRMLHDDQIRALVSLKQGAIASRGWRFRLAGDDARQQRCAEFLRFLLEKTLAGSFTQALEALLSSHVFGFSLVEKVYTPVRWNGRAYWGLAALKLRPPESFTFEVDAHGNRSGLWQQQGARRARLEPGRFIHHVYRPEIHAQYGESALRACFRHWWDKRRILENWNTYLERMAGGFIHARTVGPLNLPDREELKRVMEHINARSSVLTPGGVELSLVNAPSTDAFERAVAARDKAMARALLVPNLLGLSEQGQVGSYSQSRTQLETFFLVLSAMAESVADTLNEQLFRELARWNFGLEDPPLFEFEPLTVQQRREVAEAWLHAVRGGTVHPTPQDERYLRELLGFPAASSGETSPRAAGAALPLSHGERGDSPRTRPFSPSPVGEGVGG
jgi:hypothetical protein